MTSDWAPKTRCRENAAAARTPAGAACPLSKTRVASVADAHETIGFDGAGDGIGELLLRQIRLRDADRILRRRRRALLAGEDREALPRIERGHTFAAARSQVLVHLGRDLLSQLTPHEVNPLWRCKVLPHYILRAPSASLGRQRGAHTDRGRDRPEK